MSESSHNISSTQSGQKWAPIFIYDEDIPSPASPVPLEPLEPLGDPRVASSFLWMDDHAIVTCDSVVHESARAGEGGSLCFSIFRYGPWVSSLESSLRENSPRHRIVIER